mmetsp:Transcript_147/g.188  ORF Transcript_147/g.188 Transcript_147/m.188 type:complete len:88 (-) Transcript_147:148-411(-)|eukprot:scaffold80372_cov36-Tisochrysis_lutea.AAC.3
MEHVEPAFQVSLAAIRIDKCWRVVTQLSLPLWMTNVAHATPGTSEELMHVQERGFLQKVYLQALSGPLARRPACGVDVKLNRKLQVA